MNILIQKRTGEMVLFHESKIIQALQRAYNSVPKDTNDTVIFEITKHVKTLAKNKAKQNEILTVEEIQDFVESYLMKEDHLVAKNYILYREKHMHIRKVLEQFENLGYEKDVLCVLKQITKDLCSIKSMKASEIASYLNKGDDYIKRKYLAEMIQDKELVYLYPEMLNHPEQA